MGKKVPELPIVVLGSGAVGKSCLVSIDMKRSFFKPPPENETLNTGCTISTYYIRGK